MENTTRILVVDNNQNVTNRKNKGSSYANKLIIDYINKIRIKDKNIERQ